MKLNKLFMLGLAGLAFTACSNDDDGAAADVQKDTQLKTVSVTLPNVQTGTRGTGAPVENKSTATMNNFQIFFVDASGNFHDGYEATLGGDDNLQRTKKTAYITTYTSGTTLTYHYVDAAVTEVIVVANHGAEISTTGKSEGQSDKDYLFSLTKDIATQQDVANLIMVGEADLTKKTSGTDDSDHSNVYEAEVRVLPLVARFEIGGFKYNAVDADGNVDNTNGTRLRSSLTLQQLAINNYMGTSTYAPNDVTPTLSNESATTITNETVWSFLDGLASGNWYTDALNITLDVSNNYEASYSNSEATVLAYNVFPEAARVPQLVLRLTGTLAVADDGITEALYLATLRFTNLDKCQRGYVYSMSLEDGSPFQFKDTDFENPDKCIELSVTAEPWTVVAVTPEFQ